MKKYYHTYMKEEEKKYYSLNFLLAEKHKKMNFNNNKIGQPNLTVSVKKSDNKNIIVGRFYKNISTIYKINDNE